MQTVTLHNGAKLPAVGFGLWLMRDEEECKTAVRHALDAGYHHFDTAQIYGNEQFLGDALADAGVSRDKLFITTKISTDNMVPVDVIPSFEQSLKNLRMEYVDLVLLHFPVTELRRPAWQRMEEIAAAGKAKAIGVSNYTVKHLEELLRECSTKPAVNQVELHVYLQQPELLEFCAAHDIVVEAYSPLAHGYGMHNPVLEAIAKKYHKTPAQVMLRWCLEKGTVPLPKSVHEERIKENINVFDFSLDAADMTELAKLDKNYRTAWDPTHVA